MKFAQRLFMGIGGLAAAAALLTMVSPKAHAVVATLVEVANTRSSPVPTQDADHPGRHPYQQTCQVVGTDQFGYLNCYMPTVPPNTEVVIQSLSMVLYGSTVPQFSQLITVGGGRQVLTDIPLFAQAVPFFMNTISLTQYADANSQPSCDIQTNQTSSANPAAALTCTIIGYTVSLP